MKALLSLHVVFCIGFPSDWYIFPTNLPFKNQPKKCGEIYPSYGSSEFTCFTLPNFNSFHFFTIPSVYYQPLPWDHFSSLCLRTIIVEKYPPDPCMVYFPTFGWFLNVGKYTIHGSYGVYGILLFFSFFWILVLCSTSCFPLQSNKRSCRHHFIFCLHFNITQCYAPGIPPA